MRVGIIAYLAHAGTGYRAAGVSVYVKQLLNWLPRLGPENSYSAFVASDLPVPRGVQAVRARLTVTNPLTRTALEQIYVPIVARQSQLDLVHAPVNVLPAAVVRRASVVTVHDLAFLAHPQRFRRGRPGYLRRAIRASAERATLVVAVSNSTRSDLVRLLGVPEEKIRVVYQGVDGAFRVLSKPDRDTFKTRVLAGRPYILHVGTLEPRKNLDVLIRAYAALRKSIGIPHALVLAGGSGWARQHLAELVRDLGAEADVVFQGFVPDEDLPGWYNCADLFVYPSAYEGFGLPVLEAMACGVPTITSASSSLLELAADACISVEPGSEEALRVALAKALQDDAERTRLMRAGLKRAALFSWERTAAATLRVYEEAAGGPRS
ncbi:MAG TPA: glycosyltransferase family 1 protein [Chloroflexota bacterium]|nr:glycosyltransferase family 1 protein [Chloroflexota bacterium]